MFDIKNIFDEVSIIEKEVWGKQVAWCSKRVKCFAANPTAAFRD